MSYNKPQLCGHFALKEILNFQVKLFDVPESIPTIGRTDPAYEVDE